MKRILPVLSFVLLVLGIELACFREPILDWFCLQIYLVLAVSIAGVALWFPRKTRPIARLLLSAGALATLAGAATYFLYPFFESTSPPATTRLEVVVEVLGSVLGRIFYAGMAMAIGLFVGWFPAWLYSRSRKIDESGR